MAFHTPLSILKKKTVALWSCPVPQKFIALSLSLSLCIYTVYIYCFNVCTLEPPASHFSTFQQLAKKNIAIAHSSAFVCVCVRTLTLRQTNMDPENGTLKGCYLLQTGGFQGPC